MQALRFPNRRPRLSPNGEAIQLPSLLVERVRPAGSHPRRWSSASVPATVRAPCSRSVADSRAVRRSTPRPRSAASGGRPRARRIGPARLLAEQIEAEGRLWKQNPQRLREVLAQGAARAKIPPITPHALRHTFGTSWLQAGGDIYKLSKILGHSSVAVTEAHYVHLLEDDLVAASRQITLPTAERRNSSIVPITDRRA